ncbi:28913_t:CDS:2, partial [Racocetra persica]
KVDIIIYNPIEAVKLEPQLRYLGDATPPLEWVGLQRAKAYNIIIGSNVDYNIRSTIPSHIKSNNHQKNKTVAEQTTRIRQQTLPTVLQASELRKNAVTSLVKAFVEANIPLEKVDKL